MDRPQAQVGRPTQPSGTNRPSSYSIPPPADAGRACGRGPGPGGAFERCAALRARTGGPADENAPCWPAAMAGEAHPVPSRTRKLSPLAPMVLRCSPWESRTPPASKGRFPSHVLRPAPGRPGAGLFCFVGHPGRAEIAHPHRTGLSEPSFVKMRDLGAPPLARRVPFSPV